MELLHSTDTTSSNGLCLNLDPSSLATDALPPLTFLADASLWFEATQEHSRRPSVTECPQNSQNWVNNGGSESLDALVTAACTSGNQHMTPIEHGHVPQYTQLGTAATTTNGMLGVGSAEADRLEVARIMEQLKKGWDGTTIGDHSGTDGISCHFESNTLFVDLCPLFTDELRNTIHQDSLSREHLPVQLRFPFGSVTVLVPLTQLWPSQQIEQSSNLPPTKTDDVKEHEKPDGQSILISSINESFTEDGTKRWKCHLCEKIYSTKGGLQSHFLIHTNQRPFACRFCEKTFRQVGHLQTHLMLHRGLKNFQCQHCGKEFVQKPQLSRHIHSCPKNVPSTSSNDAECSILKSDLKTQNRRKPVPCPQCCKPVTKLSRHMRLVHDVENESRSYICSECGSEFKLAHHWKTHMAVHEQVKKWKCNKCEQSFGLEQHLKRHINTIHGLKNDETIIKSTFNCYFCQKSFTRKDCLKDHQRIHIQPSTLECDLCDRKFRRPYRLKEHKAIAHSGIKQKTFTCDKCKVEFKRMSNLKRHKLKCCPNVTFNQQESIA